MSDQLQLLRDMGLTDEQVEERILQGVIDRVFAMRVMQYDPDTGVEYDDDVPTKFAKRIEETVKAELDRRFDELATSLIAPQVAALLDGYTWNPTNKYGEKRGDAESLTEYLVRRCDLWMREPVDFNGRAKHDRDIYNWRQHSTRLEHMMDQHLRLHMETAVKGVLKEAHSTLGQALGDAARGAIDKLMGEVQVVVKQGRG